MRMAGVCWGGVCVGSFLQHFYTMHPFRLNPYTRNQGNPFIAQLTVVHSQFSEGSISNFFSIYSKCFHINTHTEEERKIKKNNKRIVFDMIFFLSILKVTAVRQKMVWSLKPTQSVIQTDVYKYTHMTFSQLCSGTQSSIQMKATTFIY